MSEYAITQAREQDSIEKLVLHLKDGTTLEVAASDILLAEVEHKMGYERRVDDDYVAAAHRLPDRDELYMRLSLRIRQLTFTRPATQPTLPDPNIVENQPNEAQ